MTIKPKSRMSRADWLTAGMAALCADGPAVLRAEVLARRIGVTKGSFYWHFADVPAFHAALLDSWERAQMAALDASAEGGSTAQLRRLCQSIAGAKTSEGWPAIRAWGHSNALALDTALRVDAAMLARIEALLRDLGIGNPEMARIIYGAATGMAGMGSTHPDQNTEAAGSLIDLVLALR